jgi:hypothetical protein
MSHSGWDIGNVKDYEQLLCGAIEEKIDFSKAFSRGPYDLSLSRIS